MYNLLPLEANWGSSAQAQVFVNALKGVQVLNFLFFDWVLSADISYGRIFELQTYRKNAFSEPVFMSHDLLFERRASLTLLTM